MKKKIIIDRGDFTAQEALIFAFTISADIDIRDGTISSNGYGSAIVKQNKDSVRLQLFRPLIEDPEKDYITRLLETICNTLYNFKIGK